MEKKIAEILEDIYAIAPDLRGREEELKKTVKKLLSSKPQTEMDQAFKDELLQEILHTYAKPAKGKRKKKLFLRPTFVIATAASVLIVVVGLFVFQKEKSSLDHEIMTAVAPEASLKEKIDSTQPPIKEAPIESLNLPDEVVKPQKEGVIKKAIPPQQIDKQPPEQETATPKEQKLLLGNLKVTIKDEVGSLLQGVNGTLMAKNSNESLSSVSNIRGVMTFKDLPAGAYELYCELPGFTTVRIVDLNISADKDLGDVVLPLATVEEEITISAVTPQVDTKSTEAETFTYKKLEQPASIAAKEKAQALQHHPPRYTARPFNTESYDFIKENSFLKVIDTPLSTFSIDVDTASYANVRRFLWNRQIPPKDAVRIEELINYFPYDYPQPSGKQAFSVTTELSRCPWDQSHYLLLLGLKGKDLSEKEIPASNLVFLIDVSGSMNDPKKLPLLVDSFKLLTLELTANDRVAIVVYAGSSGLVLPSTSGSDQQIIIDALNRLRAGGSTAGGEGIKLAYEIASKYLIEGGNNRVILATDGDFNVGPSSDAEMVRLIEEKRKMGIFLTVLGFGMGNYKDSKMEKLADKGNGNYFYIDSLLEAKKVLVNDLRKTLFTIAKDVKIQIEFNPTQIRSYRLLGYENRLMEKQEFDDDTKDAGEIGAGHTVTVFYELIPQTKNDTPREDKLRYQRYQVNPEKSVSQEMLHIKMRYKKPDADKSTLLEKVVKDIITPFDKTSETFRFASAVAEFGFLLRDSEFKGEASFQALIERAESSVGQDRFGYRHEFLKLARIAADLLGDEDTKE